MQDMPLDPNMPLLPMPSVLDLPPLPGLPLLNFPPPYALLVPEMMDG